MNIAIAATYCYDEKQVNCSGTDLGELLVICWKMKQVTDISYVCMHLPKRLTETNALITTLKIGLNWPDIATWRLCSNKHVYWERWKHEKEYIFFFFAVQINNMDIFLSRRKEERVKIALK